MKKPENIKKPTKKSPRKDESIQERVRRHLTDKNSVITDEDIKNVKTELTIRGETVPGSNRNE